MSEAQEQTPPGAGRDLDLLVSAKLGYEWKEYRWIDPATGFNAYDASWCHETGLNQPQYSTDIGAAWEIVEKAGFSVIRADDDEWMVGVLEITGIGDKYGNMEDVDVRFPNGWRAATTPAHAIVLAFLDLPDEVKE